MENKTILKMILLAYIGYSYLYQPEKPSLKNTNITVGNQNEIKTKRNLLDKKGEIFEPGFSKKPLVALNH